MNKKVSVSSAIASAFILVGCGMMGLSGSYNVTQQGGQFQQNPACSQIMLSINQSGNQITGQGQNQCFTQTLQGTSTSNGQANVTLTLAPSYSGQTNWTNYPSNTYNPYNSGYQNMGGMGCTYQGMLIISGNTISGSLNPTGNCMSQGMITLNGTRI